MGKKNIPDSTRKLVYERDGLKCYLCRCDVTIGKKKGQRTACVDHFIPRRIARIDHPNNLNTCCTVCDQKKKGKIPRIFYLDLPFALVAAFKLLNISSSDEYKKVYIRHSK